MSRPWISIVPCAVVALAAACGSSQPPAAVPSAVPEEPAAAAPAVSASAAPVAPAMPAASATPAPEASAPAPEASPPAPTEPGAAPAASSGPYRFETKSTSGRPIPRYEVDKEIETTIGGGGGVFKIGPSATLFVPEGALRQGMNVLFAIDAKAKGPKGGLGPVYRVGPQAASAGPPFQIALALPAGMKTASFAIEVTSSDAKGKAKTEWKILAPSHVAADQKLVVLDLDTLPDGHVSLVATP